MYSNNKFFVFTVYLAISLLSIARLANAGKSSSTQYPSTAQPSMHRTTYVPTSSANDGTTVFVSSLANSCTHNSTWDTIYGVNSGYIVWLSTLSISWIVLLIWCIVSMLKSSHLPDNCLCIATCSVCLARIISILILTKDTAAPRFSCSELLFVANYSSIMPLERFLLVVEGSNYILFAAIVSKTVLLRSNDNQYLSGFAKLSWFISIIYFLEIVNLCIFSTFYSGAFVHLRILVRISQLFSGLCILITSMVSQCISFSISRIEYVANLFIGALYVAIYSSTIYELSVTSFLVYSFFARIAEVSTCVLFCIAISETNQADNSNTPPVNTTESDASDGKLLLAQRLKIVHDQNVGKNGYTTERTGLAALWPATSHSEGSKESNESASLVTYPTNRHKKTGNFIPNEYECSTTGYVAGDELPRPISNLSGERLRNQPLLVLPKRQLDEDSVMSSVSSKFDYKSRNRREEFKI